jgi:predicted ribosome quality control (RQC) complex YloA/Tae2 family protein
MFHNYFFLKRLAPALDKALKGLALLECFSQNKDELVLGFADKEKEFYIRANLDPNISLLSFPDSFARAGRNSIDLFPGLINQKVASVSVFDFERSFQVLFTTGNALIFKMHGRRANILHAKNEKVLKVFRKSLPADLELIPSALNKNITVSKEAFKEHDFNPQSFIPALGKEVKIHLEQSGFNDLNEEEKWEKFDALLTQLDQNGITLIDGNTPKISLIETGDSSTQDPVAATNWLYDTTARKAYFEKEKNLAINQLKQRIKKSEGYILKTSDKLREMEKSRSPEEIANILMANLHQVQKGLSKVVLTDFYSNEPIEIKLNVTLSPQKNAENLYRKSKNRHQEINSLKENIEAKEKLIEKVSRQVLHIDEIDNTKELRKYLKENGLVKKEKVQEEHLPYHVFEVDGWQIFVGRNAKANDELTLKVANKNDLWLHAKDVAGSHVVVRQQPGQNFPIHIIEKAASLAAFNSKRKTDTLCPVIYTPKKFVRKAKGSPAGQVIVEKEEVVMVEPANV